MKPGLDHPFPQRKEFKYGPASTAGFAETRGIFRSHAREERFLGQLKLSSSEKLRLRDLELRHHFPMHRKVEIRTLTAVAVRCPKCSGNIPDRDTNPETDIALCRRCTEWFSLAASAGESREAALDFGNPPAGAWHRLDGFVTELGASTRSSLAFLLVPFGLMSLPFGLPMVVAWALSEGDANWMVGVIGLLGLVFSAAVVPMSLMSVCGKVRVRADGDHGEVFSGIGPVGRRWRFRWSERLRIEYKTFTSDGDGKPAAPVIEIVAGGRRKWIGALLTEERKRFLYRGLRQLARERGVYL